MSAPFRFYTEVKVRYHETDLQGHVNFGHYLFYFDVGATEYMAAIGYGYETLLAEGVDLLYAESHCNYHARAHYPDVLRVYTRVGHVGRRSLRYEFEVRAARDGRLVATGHIVAITAARGTWDKRAIPAALRAAVAGYEGPEAAAAPGLQQTAAPHKASAPAAAIDP